MRCSLETLMGKKNLVGCEIGVDKADNARTILENLDLQRLYLVEPFGEPLGYDKKTVGIAKEKMKKFQGKTKIVWLMKKSEDVTDEEIPHGALDFVYIDGDHHYPVVTADIKRYWPRVKKGGLFAGHDCYIDKYDMINGKITEGHGQVYEAVKDFFTDMGFNGHYLRKPIPACNFQKFKIYQVYGSDWWVYK